MFNIPKKKTPIIAFIITFIVVFVILFTINKFYEQKESKKNSEKANLLMLNITNEIQSKIAQGVTAVESQILLLKQSDYSTSDFDIWAKEIIKGKNSIASLQLAKDGVVSNIYPLEEHKIAMGHDLLKDKRRNDGALLAISKKDVTFIGPVKLIQNGRFALIARKAIFQKINEKIKFWGFSTVLIYVDNIIKPLEQKIKDNGFEYQLEGFDPDTSKRPLFVKSKDFTGKDILEFNVNVPNGKWIFILEKH